MGLQDLDRLYPVYRHATDISRMHLFPFSFTLDTGSFETAIVFNEMNNSFRKPMPHENWESIKYPEVIIVPDMSCYDARIIIEFEEETGNRKSGSHMAKKGHGHDGDLPTKRDSRRNHFYECAGFKLFRVWESNFKKDMWKIALTEFLIDCYRKNLHDSMTVYSKKIKDIE